MRFKWVPIAALVAGAGAWTILHTDVKAQVRSQDPNIIMMDNCSPEDPAYDALGGCPEGSPRGANA